MARSRNTTPAAHTPFGREEARLRALYDGCEGAAWNACRASEALEGARNHRTNWTRGGIDNWGLPADGAPFLYSARNHQRQTQAMKQVRRAERREGKAQVREALEDMLQPEPPTMREAMLAAWKKECREYLTWNAGQLMGRSLDKDLTPLQKNVLLQAAHHLQMMAA